MTYKKSLLIPVALFIAMFFSTQVFPQGKDDKTIPATKYTYYEGLGLYKKGDYKGAKSKFEAVLKHDPANQDAKDYLKVISHISSGKTQAQAELLISAEKNSKKIMPEQDREKAINESLKKFEPEKKEIPAQTSQPASNKAYEAKVQSVMAESRDKEDEARFQREYAERMKKAEETKKLIEAGEKAREEEARTKKEYDEKLKRLEAETKGRIEAALKAKKEEAARKSKEYDDKLKRIETETKVKFEETEKKRREEEAKKEALHQKELKAIKEKLKEQESEAKKAEKLEIEKQKRDAENIRREIKRKAEQARKEALEKEKQKAAREKAAEKERIAAEKARVAAEKKAKKEAELAREIAEKKAKKESELAKKEAAKNAKELKTKTSEETTPENKISEPKKKAVSWLPLKARPSQISTKIQQGPIKGEPRKDEPKPQEPKPAPKPFFKLKDDPEKDNLKKEEAKKAKLLKEEKNKRKALERKDKRAEAKRRARLEAKAWGLFGAKEDGLRILLDDISNKKIPEGALTLDQCVAIAMKNNVKLETAEKQVKLAKMKQWQAKRNLGPKVKALAEESGGQINARHYEGKKIKIEYNQPLYHGGELVYAAGQARVNLEIVQADYDRIKNEIVLQVEKAYYSLDKAIKAYELQSKMYDKTAQLNQTVKKEYDQGVVSKVEYLNVVSKYNQIDFQRTSAREDISLTKLILQQALNTQDDVNIVSVAPPDVKNIALEDCYTIGFSNRPELKVNFLKAEYYLYEKKIMGARLLPRVDLLGNWGYGYEDYVEADMDVGRNINKFLPEWNAGVKVSLPFFGNTGYYNYTREKWQPQVSSTQSTESLTNQVGIGILDGMEKDSDQLEADIEFQKSQQEFDKIKNEVKTEIQETYFKLKKAIIQMGVAKSKVEFQSRQVDTLEIKMRNNEAPASNILEELIKLAEEEFGFLQAIADYYIAIKTLNKAIGLPGYFN